MKSMKKTLSIILAAVMLFAVCSMSVSAAVPDGNAIALGIKVKDGQVIEKGKTVTFVVTLEESADFYSNYGGLNVGEFEIAYNSAIFEPVPTTGYGDSSLAGHGVSVKKSETESYAVAGGVDTVNSSVKAAEYGVDAVNNWDSAMHITLIENGAADLAARYVDCSKGAVDTFEFQLKVKADAADGTYKIGHNKTGYDNYATYVISGKDGDASHGWFVFEEATINCTPIYDFGTCDVTVGSAGGEGGDSGDTPAAPEAVVNTLPTQVQWKEADPTSGLMNVAFRGQIASGYNAVADKTGEDGPNGAKLASLSKVGVYLSVDGGAKTPYESQVIYNFTDGTYFFRVVVGNWAYNDAKELKAEAFIVIKGADGKDYEFKGSEITTSGTQEYTRATTKAENPMPEYAGA